MTILYCHSIQNQLAKNTSTGGAVHCESYSNASSALFIDNHAVGGGAIVSYYHYYVLLHETLVTTKSNSAVTAWWGCGLQNILRCDSLWNRSCNNWPK